MTDAPATIELETLRVREIKTIQRVSGLGFSEVVRQIHSGYLDAEVFEALALVMLQRTNPNATVEDAAELQGYSIFPEKERADGDDPAV